MRVRAEDWAGHTHRSFEGPRRKWLSLAIACLAAVAAVTVIPAHAALASGGGDGCNPHRGNNYLTYIFDGADHPDPGIPGGVYATISNYSPFVAGPNQGAPSNDFTSEWVMLDNDATQWVQIGWVEFAGSVRNTFWEWTKVNGDFEDAYASAFPINSAHTYTVLYQPGNTNPFVVQVDGGTYATIPQFFTPNDAQIFAELHTQASQMPGGTADDPTHTPLVSNAHLWPTSGSGGWQNFNGTTATGASWAKISPAPGSTGVNTWRTWDTACTT